MRQLFAKLGRLNEKEREAIERTIDRIVNKLLHPPLEALRDEARKGSPYGLIDALKCLFTSANEGIRQTHRGRRFGHHSISPQFGAR